MERKLFIDFETKDIGLNNKIGPGWSRKGMMEVIGYSYAMDNEDTQWSDDIEYLKELVNECTHIIAHNAQYELGALTMLDIDFSDKFIFCTKIGAKLYNSTLLSSSLDFLGEYYLKTKKDTEGLAEAAIELELCKPTAKNAAKVAITNMKTLYEFLPQTVIKYAIIDTDICRQLYYRFKDSYVVWMSDLIKCTVDMRARGVKVDVKELYRQKDEMQSEIESLEKEIQSRISKVIGAEININSKAQVGNYFAEIGANPPLTPKTRKSSVNSDWLAANKKEDGDDYDLLLRHAKISKVLSSFLNSVIAEMKAVEGTNRTTGTFRIHPEFNILGAAKTGRFSSSNPNFQQLPKESDIRKMYIPEEGTDWYCLDFSAQESRVQVHYGAKIESSTGLIVADKWRKDPEYDMHADVAMQVFNVTPENEDFAKYRKKAKTINLGLSYGMGSAVLAQLLGLPTTWKINVTGDRYLVGGEETIELINNYFEAAPYLKDLDLMCKSSMKNAGKITTIAGRDLYLDAPQKLTNGKIKQSYEYRGLNKLIQGSSADQTMLAMVMAYRDGIKLTATIHDELVICTSSLEEVARLRKIMEEVLKLNVPMRSEVTKGRSFGEQETVKREELDALLKRDTTDGRDSTTG